MSDLLRRLLISAQDVWSSARETVGILFTSQTLFPRLLRVVAQPVEALVFLEASLSCEGGSSDLLFR